MVFWRPRDSLEDRMNLRPSATVALASLISLLALAGQWVAFSVSADVLEASVREREIDKINTVSSVVKGIIAEKQNDIVFIARLLAADSSLSKSIALKGPERVSTLKSAMDKMFQLGRIQTLEVADTNETVAYRAHEPNRYGDQATGWGVAEALAGKSISASRSVNGGVAIQAMEPLRQNAEVVGVVSAGLLLNKKLMDELSHQVGAHLALLGRKGAIAAAEGGAMDGFDLRGMEEAFEKKIPIYRFDTDARQTSVYLPILVVDEAYVVLARMDSRDAYGLIEKGKQRSGYVAALILVVSLVVGFLVLHWVLGPLRKLRQRAERTAMDLTGESIATHGRDEVVSVVNVLDALTDRLVQRNQDLAQAKAQADAASLAKSQFLSAMSHEIRTPLNGVLGMAELLMDTPLSRDQVRFVGAIESAGRVLHGLLSDILDLAKIEEGQVKLECIDFDPKQTTVDLSSVFSAMASTRSIALVTDLSDLNCDWAAGDPTRFKQVLSNLLSNAMKFTPRGEIRLRGESIAAPNDDSRPWCRFSVEDTGIGMTPEALNKLFQRFEQADISTTRHYGGSGLGLAISKHLVELMGGHVHAQSVLGEGSRFWFDIPFEIPSAPLPPTPVRSGKAQMGGLKILVAEDNAINQLVVKTLLTRLGAEITIVENGKLALEEVKQGVFDLVFMDCQMPVMDGFEATRKIRQWEAAQLARPGFRPLPIVALTANALAGDREACLAAGMTDYVSKPVTSAALAQALERHRPADFSPTAPVIQKDDPKETGAPAFDASVLGIMPMVMDGSDPGFADEMLDLFAVDARKTLTAIDQATHEVDMAALTRLVHTLKSSSAQVGAMALSAVAAKQEALLRGGRMGEGDWRGELKQAFDRFESHVRKHRDAL